MKKVSIPLHSLSLNEFFLIDKIESSKEIRFAETHRHSFYEVLWFTDVNENENHWIDFQNYSIERNQIYILSPNQVHQMDIGSKKGYVIAFVTDFFRGFFELPPELLLKPYHFAEVIPDETAIILKKIVDLMTEEHNGLKRGKLISAYATAFFMHIAPLFGEKLTIHSDKLATVLKLIEKHFKEEKEVGFYAKEVSLSIRRLNEISVLDTGLTVKQIILDRLITEAKRLVITEKMSFKEIAYHLGFNDPAYFSRLFKQKTERTPEEFRTHIFTSSRQ